MEEKTIQTRQFMTDCIPGTGNGRPGPGYLTPQNSERRMAPVFLRQIEISYYS